MKIFYPSC